MNGKDGDIMFNFFADDNSRHGDSYIIGGQDYNHIKNVLRMKSGDIFLVSHNGVSHLCSLESFEGECVIARIIEENYNDTELPVEITLFQGLPKSDKMELIIQKTVELGVHSVIPVEMSRCVVKLDEKKKKSKTVRWQSISESAAKQSKRTVIPEIFDAVSYKEALKMACEYDLFLVPYENEEGMKATAKALSQIKRGSRIAVLVGPEGGFDENEIRLAVESGGLPVSLGKRILRTETAALTAVGMCMLYTEMNIDGEE